MTRCLSLMLLPVILLLLVPNVVESKFVVKTLPGFVGDLPFTLETGYVGVGELDDVQLFYYLVESERNPNEDPLVLWLTGGPGCSGLSSLLYEMGSFTIDNQNSCDNPKLVLNPYTWTQVANIIFLDQPVGTGFSYAERAEAYVVSDTIAAAQTYDFLRKWLGDHPKFLDNPLYIAGESYAGIVLAIVIQEIYNGNEVGNEPWMNIKGYIMGNAATDRKGDCNLRIPFAHRMALLSDALYESTKANCRGEYMEVDPSNMLCVNDLQLVDECLQKITRGHILEPWCDDQGSVTTNNILARDVIEETSINLSSLPLRRTSGCWADKYRYSSIWANKRDVQEALHIQKGTNNYEWVRCNHSLTLDDYKKKEAYTYDVESTVAYHQNFTYRSCRALIYSGDHDMIVPYMGTMEWIKSLNLSVESKWRPWFVEGQVAGYTTNYSKKDYQLTFATVKGGGHTAPENKPEQCAAMVSRWFADDPL